MAKPIEKTPVLQGKDAKAFFANLLILAKQEQTASNKKKKAQQIERMKKNYDAFFAISEGVL
jgi:hypothetical protein